MENEARSGLSYHQSGRVRPFLAKVPERLIPNPKLRFLDQCREVLRFKQMSLRTEQAYVHWVRRFILWSGKRHPREMGAPEVRAFLTHLAAERNVAAATQNQALHPVR